MRLKLNIALLFLFTLSLVACNEQQTFPKPKGYLRLELPKEKGYKKIETAGYSFEIPKYAQLIDGKNGQKNIFFKDYKAMIHLTHLPVRNDSDLRKYLEDARKFVSEHQVKASGISENYVFDDSTHIYGTVYELKGNVASFCQFYITDSTDNFLRGALYFNMASNYDSIQPVLRFIQEDIYQIANTINWK